MNKVLLSEILGMKIDGLRPSMSSLCFVALFFISSDINECETLNLCDGQADCLNNAGSYTCRCHSGFAGVGCDQSEYPMKMLCAVCGLVFPTQIYVHVVARRSTDTESL